MMTDPTVILFGDIHLVGFIHRYEAPGRSESARLILPLSTGQYGRPGHLTINWLVSLSVGSDIAIAWATAT